jgi:hypothetical protein
MSVSDEPQRKPAWCSTLATPTRRILPYSRLLPVLWLLAVVADHL